MTIKNACFEIRLTFVDDLKNGFTKIGRAAWATKEEQANFWAAIPLLAEDQYSDFIAELIDDDEWTILKEKRVSAETCEQLMGESIVVLIDQGRKDTCYSLGDLNAIINKAGVKI